MEVAPFGLGLGEFERALVGLPGLGVAAVASEQVGPGGVVVAVAVEPELVETARPWLGHIACGAVGAIDAAVLPWTIVRRRADTTHCQ